MPLVVLIHGLIGHFADERAVSLLRPATVLSPDLLGYGSEADADPHRITIEDQAEYVLAAVDRAPPGSTVHLVGHSVGGVIGALLAHRFPQRVASLVTVEGNFTLADAFWSSRLAAKSSVEVAELLAADRADPARWLRDADIEPTPDRIRSAVEALAYQPATTIRAAAKAVVEFTGRPAYEQILRAVFDRTPVHLVAGARSRAAWHVPDWARAAAASSTVIPDVGHLMMFEAPEAVGRVLARLVDSEPPRRD